MKLIKSLTKFLTVLLILLAAVIFVIKQEWLPPEVAEIFEGTFQAPPINTYYQWQNDQGQVLITKTPPPDNRFYTEFKASGEISVTATPGKESPLKPEKNALSNEDIESFQRKKRQFVANEVGTECRWLVAELVDLQITVKQTSHSKQARACSTFKQRIEQLREQNCKASDQEFKAEGCG